MASPVGSAWRNTYTGPEWGYLVRQVTLLLAGVESHESSYEPTNYSTLASKLQDAIDALNDAAAADQDSGNNGYPS
jgi:hypothetical protein